MEEKETTEYGWIIYFSGRWLNNIETKKAKDKLYRYFDKNNFLKLGIGVYARSIIKHEYELWKKEIQELIPADGDGNSIYVNQKQWDVMKIYPTQDKFLKED